jgi:hypothetical protein
MQWVKAFKHTLPQPPQRPRSLVVSTQRIPSVTRQ